MMALARVVAASGRRSARKSQKYTSARPASAPRTRARHFVPTTRATTMSRVVNAPRGI